MPAAPAALVILPAGEAWDVWLEGETSRGSGAEKALGLARPLPEGGLGLKVVARARITGHGG
jgi:hypothetical protein